MNIQGELWGFRVHRSTVEHGDGYLFFLIFTVPQSIARQQGVRNLFLEKIVGLHAEA